MAGPGGLEEAFEAAEDEATSTLDALLGRLADRVGARAGAGAVFGEPVTAGGVTVIPVARARWGFGGGGAGGGRGKKRSAGAGGGGGAMAAPVGYIELVDGQARFVAFPDAVRKWPLVLVGGLVAWLCLRALRGVFR